MLTGGTCIIANLQKRSRVLNNDYPQESTNKIYVACCVLVIIFSVFVLIVSFCKRMLVLSRSLVLDLRTEDILFCCDCLHNFFTICCPWPSYSKPN